MESNSIWFLVELVDAKFIVPIFAVLHWSHLVDKDADFENGSVALFKNITPNDPSERRGRIIRISENKQELIHRKISYEKQDEETRNMLKICSESILLMKENMAKRRKDRLPLQQLLRNQLTSLQDVNEPSGSGISTSTASDTHRKRPFEDHNQLPYSNNVTPLQPRMQQQKPGNTVYAFLQIPNQEVPQHNVGFPDFEYNMPLNPRPMGTSTPQPIEPEIYKTFRDQESQTDIPYVDQKALNETVVELRNEITLLYGDLVDAVNVNASAEGRPVLPTTLPWDNGVTIRSNVTDSSNSETVEFVQDESDDKKNKENVEPNQEVNEENENVYKNDAEEMLGYRIYKTRRATFNDNIEAGPSTSRNFPQESNNAEAALSSDESEARGLKRKMSSTTSNEPESSISPTTDDDLVPIGSGPARVPSSVLKTIDWKSHTMATRQLLRALFPRSVLATHCLTGKNSPGFQHRPPKKMLDPEIVEDIVTIVTEKCNVPINYVRNSITIKCADESKLYRKRQECAQKQKRQKLDQDEGTSSLTSEGGSTSRTDSSPI